MRVKIDEGRDSSVFIDSDCPESSYGAPVITCEYTDGTREVYGPGDDFPNVRGDRITWGDMFRGVLNSNHRNRYNQEQIEAIELFVGSVTQQ